MNNTVVDRDHTSLVRRMRASLEADVAEMRACTNNDLIFAWHYGMGVSFDANGAPHAAKLVDATSINKASPFWRARIENGHGKRAHLMRRQVALELQIASIEELLTNPALQP